MHFVEVNIFRHINNKQNKNHAIKQKNCKDKQTPIQNPLDKIVLIKNLFLKYKTFPLIT